MAPPFPVCYSRRVNFEDLLERIVVQGSEVMAPSSALLPLLESSDRSATLRSRLQQTLTGSQPQAKKQKQKKMYMPFLPNAAGWAKIDDIWGQSEEEGLKRYHKKQRRAKKLGKTMAITAKNIAKSKSTSSEASTSHALSPTTTSSTASPSTSRVSKKYNRDRTRNTTGSKSTRSRGWSIVIEKRAPFMGKAGTEAITPSMTPDQESMSFELHDEQFEQRREEFETDSSGLEFGSGSFDSSSSGYHSSSSAYGLGSTSPETEIEKGAGESKLLVPLSQQAQEQGQYYNPCATTSTSILAQTRELEVPETATEKTAGGKAFSKPPKLFLPSEINASIQAQLQLSNYHRVHAHPSPPITPLTTTAAVSPSLPSFLPFFSTVEGTPAPYHERGRPESTPTERKNPWLEISREMNMCRQELMGTYWGKALENENERAAVEGLIGLSKGL